MPGTTKVDQVPAVPALPNIEMVPKRTTGNPTVIKRQQWASTACCPNSGLCQLLPPPHLSHPLLPREPLSLSNHMPVMAMLSGSVFQELGCASCPTVLQGSPECHREQRGEKGSVDDWKCNVDVTLQFHCFKERQTTCRCVLAKEHIPTSFPAPVPQLESRRTHS